MSILCLRETVESGCAAGFVLCSPAASRLLHVGVGYLNRRRHGTSIILPASPPPTRHLSPPVPPARDITDTEALAATRGDKLRVIRRNGAVAAFGLARIAVAMMPDTTANERQDG